MVRPTQTIRLQKPMNCLSVFDYFVGLALKGLILKMKMSVYIANRTYQLRLMCKKY